MRLATVEGVPARPKNQILERFDDQWRFEYGAIDLLVETAIAIDKTHLRQMIKPSGAAIKGKADGFGERLKRLGIG